MGVRVLQLVTYKDDATEAGCTAGNHEGNLTPTQPQQHAAQMGVRVYHQPLGGRAARRRCGTCRCSPCLLPREVGCGAGAHEHMAKFQQYLCG